jgi:flavodoxin
MTGNPIDRRTVLRSSVLIAAAALAAGCTPDDAPPAVTTGPRTQETPVPRSSSAVLLVYFSRAGENYWNGGRRDLEVGNTAVLATKIVERLGCDVYEIQAADPYPEDYDETVARNVREQDEDARPEIAQPLPDVAGYDTIILASPIWNVRPPMIMSTFAEAVDLAGKTILPVTTHAMSGLGRAPEVYRDLAPGATIGEGLAIRGERAAEPETDAELDQWLSARELT